MPGACPAADSIISRYADTGKKQIFRILKNHCTLRRAGPSAYTPRAPAETSFEAVGRNQPLQEIYAAVALRGIASVPHALKEIFIAAINRLFNKMNRRRKTTPPDAK